MSGSHYQISYNQILESERRLQLSNILKLFHIKTQSTTTEKPTLMEYLGTFSQSNCEEYDYSFDVETFLSNLNLINLPEMATSQVKCLAFISGYAVFSYIKKSNGCILCKNFLTTNMYIHTTLTMICTFNLD